jgi:hypothetical protein
MAADLLTAFAVVALASALGGAILEYTIHAVRYPRRKKGHR